MNKNLTLAQQIEKEELKVSAKSITTLEKFLNKAENKSCTITYFGTHFYEKLSWTYNKAKEFIIISDEENSLLGETEIEISDLMDCGTVLFQNKMLQLDFIENGNMQISLNQ